ncbi:MAG: MATE family efflux transporter [Clostridiales bacterium]|nr:MATE family efflux transporter [Clostridiales bacterium]
MNSSQKKVYQKELLAIGLPVTLQSIFQASYSLVDQLMVGSLGTVSIAGSGLGAKFSSLVSVTLSAVAAVASILIAQYHGKQDREGINRSFFSCLYISVLVLLLFALPAFCIPEIIMGFYSEDAETIRMGAVYLKLIAVSYIPMNVTLMCSAFFRSVEKSRYPLYASILSMAVNLLGNYLLIFGKFGCPRLGLQGAAYGTLIARTLEALLLVSLMAVQQKKGEIRLRPVSLREKGIYGSISVMIVPILLNEFLWSLGENIYAGIYGRLGTDALAAMTLTNPLQAMFIGMFSGVSSAAAVMVGKRLGSNDNEGAYVVSKYLMKTGVLGSLVVSVLLVLLIPFYVKWFSIGPEVARLTKYIVYALALVLFAKITNMILGGGILRSGGRTRITLCVDLVGTWVFGVPLGLLAAFVFHLPIYMVYFILSLEEVIRLIISIFLFRSKVWMQNLTQGTIPS